MRHSHRSTRTLHIKPHKSISYRCTFAALDFKCSTHNRSRSASATSTPPPPFLPLHTAYQTFSRAGDSLCSSPSPTRYHSPGSRSLSTLKERFKSKLALMFYPPKSYKPSSPPPSPSSPNVTSHARVVRPACPSAPRCTAAVQHIVEANRMVLNVPEKCIKK